MADLSACLSAEALAKADGGKENCYEPRRIKAIHKTGGAGFLGYNRWPNSRRKADGWREDDEKACTTYDGIVGRSFRRGMRKAAKALTFGLLSGKGPAGVFKGLGIDPAKELPKAIKRSRENR